MLLKYELNKNRCKKIYTVEGNIFIVPGDRGKAPFELGQTFIVMSLDSRDMLRSTHGSKHTARRQRTDLSSKQSRYTYISFGRAKSKMSS